MSRTCCRCQSVRQCNGELFLPRLEIEDIENFPCEDLRTLNELWVKYSNGHFGFSVQKEIWIECGGKPGVYDDLESYVRFADRVGWRKDGDWLYYKDLNFTIASDRGHLPNVILPWVPTGTHLPFPSVVGHHERTFRARSESVRRCGSLLSRPDLEMGR